MLLHYKSARQHTDTSLLFISCHVCCPRLYALLACGLEIQPNGHCNVTVSALCFVTDCAVQQSCTQLLAGDVALHALTDAILGALCLPDIGQLFPDTDPQWKGANSDTFIKEAVSIILPLVLQCKAWLLLCVVDLVLSCYRYALLNCQCAEMLLARRSHRAKPLAL